MAPEERRFFKDLFRPRPRYVTVKPGSPQEPAPRTEVPDGLWSKCPGCNQLVYQKEVEKTLRVCPTCRFHFHLSAGERIGQLLDGGEFLEEWDSDLVAGDPLGFPGYAEKLARAREQTGMTEAVRTGLGTIDGLPVVLGVIDFAFLGGSMGSAVGERIVRAFERATAGGYPVVMVSTGGGGARMHEGVLSLVQMARTAQAVLRHSRAGLFFASVLADPTMGGVYASFASLGDVILAEPGARIGFTGPRVIEQTIRQKLPPGFQTAEFALRHGMIDRIVPREELRPTLAALLRLHPRRGKEETEDEARHLRLGEASRRA